MPFPCNVRSLKGVAETPDVPPRSRGLRMELGGRWWKKRVYRYEASICALDVNGRPQMAPRAGFEIDGKPLMRKDRALAGHADTPASTPFLLL